jgi:hypothetical protein
MYCSTPYYHDGPVPFAQSCNTNMRRHDSLCPVRDLHSLSHHKSFDGTCVPGSV